MIPRANITAWRAKAPWSSDAQVEQDLVLSRALVEVFSDPLVARELAARGGTMLHKIFFDPPARYSEDIDLVQVRAGPIGLTMNALRARLDPWLGSPRFERRRDSVRLVYRFDSEFEPVVPLRLKIEINTREHFAVHGLHPRTFAVDNAWFTGTTETVTYALEELLGTKMRALYQRKKGRDLFDIAMALQRFPDLDRERIVACFEEYMAVSSGTISRAQYEANLAAKEGDPLFGADIAPLLANAAVMFADDAFLDGRSHPDDGSLIAFDVAHAFRIVRDELVTLLPGEPWRGP